MNTAAEFYLVSCVAGKRSHAVPAKDLYLSEWFQRARSYVERAGKPWFILSAQHGLLAPDMIVDPYEQTLNTMDVHSRRKWAKSTQAQMETMLPAASRCLMLAGARYREFLMPYLMSRFETSVPMQGLAIGKQLQWLGPRLTPAGTAN
ncbi:hypothetical protein KZJ38_07275 [Paraburkholderia edwinii]|uniref:DUF6884 domain-containing protein n=1 Tax=Paraburkholderia edwinii TaxID=2861782 RepID=A0ABX8USZ5_9BURK|nr:DUF6884 domain-containing protein [Paraburkholderia edwinii]QYD70104.1 hypothetical protein KZJ38_07275 [Paraburkholderia edwinii]